MGSEEAVILVVGVDERCQYRVAKALADGRGASDVDITKGGTRTFRRKSSPEAVVVQTTSLVTYEGPGALAHGGRVWVSMNSLRGLSGKHIFVVCVLTSSGPDDPIFQWTDFWKEKYTWLKLLAFIFKENQKAIMLLVKLEGEDESGAKKSAIKDVLQRDGFTSRNISFETFERKDLVPTVKFAIARSLYSGKEIRNEKDSKDTLKPFLLKEAKGDDLYGPWGPQRAILFGRTGSGKSTLAHMLTRGKLDPNSGVFASSSSIRGETKKLQHGQGRSWDVVDTPGFGEPAKDKHSTVSTKEAAKKIKTYVQLIDGVYSHFIYVVAMDRIDQLEIILWKFFVQLFGEEMKYHFSVVISNSTKDWVAKNEAHLRKSFVGCTSFLSAEFPPIVTDDNEWEEELQEVRTASLKELEEEFNILQRSNVVCDRGVCSKGTLKSVMANNTFKIREKKSKTQRALMFLEAGLMKSQLDLYWLKLALTRDHQVMLIPTL